MQMNENLVLEMTFTICHACARTGKCSRGSCSYQLLSKDLLFTALGEYGHSGPSPHHEEWNETENAVLDEWDKAPEGYCGALSLPQSESDSSDDSSHGERPKHKVNKCRHRDEDLQPVGKDSASSDRDGLVMKSVQNDEGHLGSYDSEHWCEVISNSADALDGLGSETLDENDSSHIGEPNEVTNTYPI